MAGYAHYALHKFRMLPSVFADLSIENKAFMIASIRIKMGNDKKEIKQIKSKARR